MGSTSLSLSLSVSLSLSSANELGYSSWTKEGIQQEGELRPDCEPAFLQLYKVNHFNLLFLVQN